MGSALRIQTLAAHSWALVGMGWPTLFASGFTTLCAGAWRPPLAAALPLTDATVHRLCVGPRKWNHSWSMREQHGGPRFLTSEEALSCFGHGGC